MSEYSHAQAPKKSTHSTADHSADGSPVIPLASRHRNAARRERAGRRPKSATPQRPSTRTDGRSPSVHTRLATADRLLQGVPVRGETGGPTFSSPQQTVSEVVNAFIHLRVKHLELTEKTLLNHQAHQTYRIWIEGFGARPMLTISQQEVDDWLQHLTARGWSAGTIDRTHALVAAAHEWHRLCCPRTTKP